MGKLKTMLKEDEFLLLPGIYDCLSAKIAEEVGFKCLFLSGGALAVTKIGKPDIGFLNLNEFRNSIENITNTISTPLIADIDNGFGNAIHAANAAKEFEKAGAEGLQIDDKELPALDPRKDVVLDMKLVTPKIKSIRENVSEDFLIIFRTCANLYGYGIEEAIKRINLAKDFGADVAYVDGIKSIEELKKVSENAEIDLMVNLNEKGFCGSLDIDEIKKYNYKIGLFPISTMLASAYGLYQVLEDLHKNESTMKSRNVMVEPKKVHTMMGLYSLTEKYSKLYKDS